MLLPDICMKRLATMEQRHTLVLKGMVCNRCIAVLKASLESLPVSVEEISLGKVTLSGLANLTEGQLQRAISDLNFEIIESRDQKLIREMKNLIHAALVEENYSGKVRFSKLISERMNMSYDSLSAIFTRMEGISVASYVINKRIEKIKEYLKFSDSSLTEIAYLTGYSSVFHLSAQFKEITGLTPSAYRKGLETGMAVGLGGRF